MRLGKLCVELHHGIVLETLSLLLLVIRKLRVVSIHSLKQFHSATRHNIDTVLLGMKIKFLVEE